MKRWIHAAELSEHYNTTGWMTQFHKDNEYYERTRKDEVEFDHDVVWSVQFYTRMSNLAYDKEYFVLAKNPDEAFAKAEVLGNQLGYDPNNIVVQYAYKDPESTHITKVTL